MESAENSTQVATPRAPWTPAVVEFFNLRDAQGTTQNGNANADGGNNTS